MYLWTFRIIKTNLYLSMKVETITGAILLQISGMSKCRGQFVNIHPANTILL